MSFSALCTETASTKRPPAISGGKRGVAVSYLTSITTTRLYPLDAEKRQALEIDTPHELLEVFTLTNYDILEGDIFVYGGVDYPVRAAEEWGDYVAMSGGARLRLILEDLKRG